VSRVRQTPAKWALPTLDEWYKAAFYVGPGYNLYPTGGSISQSMANYNHPTGSTVSVGSFAAYASPSGTLNQGGNVDELLSPGDGGISIWGGNYTSADAALASSAALVSGSFTVAAATDGFRVVRLPDIAGGLMNTANRASGAAPLAVVFDAVDTDNLGTLPWSSGVVQPPPTIQMVLGRGSSNITGVTVDWVSYDTPSGTGTLNFYYDSQTGAPTFKWTAPGDQQAGAPVPWNPQGQPAGPLLLTSFQGLHSVVITVTTGDLIPSEALPPNGATDPIAIDAQLSPDYAPYHYEWNFGDDQSGTWTTDGKSKNTAVGYIAAHVYENTGNHTVTLTVTTPCGQVYNYQEQISVGEMPGTPVFYVDSVNGSDDPNNNGTSENTPFKSFNHAMGELFKPDGVGYGTVRFKRGNGPGDEGTFIVSDGHFTAPSLSGPFLITGYGNGNFRPVIKDENSGGSDPLLKLQATMDVRITDVDFTSDVNTESGVSPGQTFTLLRSDMSGFSAGVTGGDTQSPTLFGAVITDCHMYGIRDYGIYCYNAAQMGVLGCQLELNTAPVEHCLRTYISKSVVAHSIFQHGAGGKHLLKFCGLPPEQGGSQYCVISDNLFMNPSQPNQAVADVASFGSENVEDTQLVQNIVIERNQWLLPAGELHHAIHSHGANRMTVRNNVAINCEVFIATDTPMLSGSTWDQWNILNNTWAFQGQNLSDCSFMTDGTDGPFANLSVRNNLAVSLNGGTQNNADLALKLPGTIAPMLIEDHDLWYFPNAGDLLQIGPSFYATLTPWQGTGEGMGDAAADPLIVQYPDPGPDGRWGTQDDVAGNLHLPLGSPGRGTALFTPYVREDFDGSARPAAGADMGAFQHQPQ